MVNCKGTTMEIGDKVKIKKLPYYYSFYKDKVGTIIGKGFIFKYKVDLPTPGYEYMHTYWNEDELEKVEEE